MLNVGCDHRDSRSNSPHKSGNVNDIYWSCRLLPEKPTKFPAFHNRVLFFSSELTQNFTYMLKQIKW